MNKSLEDYMDKRILNNAGKEVDQQDPEDIVKSISYDQDELIKWIIKLYCPDGFDLDPTYGKGNFYKKIPGPKLKFDINPQIEGVKQANCTDIPLSDNSLNSIMFDPPFVAGSRKDGKPGIIKERFGYYKTTPDLWEMYGGALKEFYRILRARGVLIFKCQDCIDSSKQYLSHVEIINMAYSIGFYPKDIFILLAKNRIMSPNQYNQQHARKFHSYFIVFIEEKRKVKYYGLPMSYTEGNNKKNRKV